MNHHQPGDDQSASYIIDARNQTKCIAHGILNTLQPANTPLSAAISIKSPACDIFTIKSPACDIFIIYPDCKTRRPSTVPRILAPRTLFEENRIDKPRVSSCRIAIREWRLASRRERRFLMIVRCDSRLLKACSENMKLLVPCTGHALCRSQPRVQHQLAACMPTAPTLPRFQRTRNSRDCRSFGVQTGELLSPFGTGLPIQTSSWSNDNATLPFPGWLEPGTPQEKTMLIASW
ncbi:hypothetical protein V8F20_010859 [Naviculisporaceae sp. PSN 640]